MSLATKQAGSTPIAEGLEMQLLVLEDAADDPMNEDTHGCIVCYQLASDCACSEQERIWWPLRYAIQLLQTVVNELGH